MHTSTTTSSSTTTSPIGDLVVRSMSIMVDGTPEDFRRVIHPEAVNREATDEPPATRVPGPEGFWATALWLRSAYSDLRFDVHDVVVDGDLVALHATMSGRHTGPFVTYDADGNVAAAMPPTGRSFAVTHSHWMRVRDGQVIEHWANRDDLGQAFQLGWIPPTPMFLVRSALAKRRAHKAHRGVTA